MPAALPSVLPKRWASSRATRWPSEVKELDQEARGALRKHGVRFGQFTIFLPALLKPAPTRLRLVLWSLWNGLQEFPESPPPGLVTIPNVAEVPKQHYTLAGYHPAGTRAIRIDMLERLADILRQKDSRAGFEATPDMLSITGMTLDQFADLMAGLGYKGEKGERVKVKTTEAPKAPEISAEAAAAIAAGQPIPEEVSILAPAPEPEAQSEAEPAAPEMEAFYTFTWAPKPRFQRPERGPRPERKEGEAPRAPRGDRPKGDRPQGERPKGDRAPRATAHSGDRPKQEGPRATVPNMTGLRATARTARAITARAANRRARSARPASRRARPRKPKSRSTPTTPSPRCSLSRARSDWPGLPASLNQRRPHRNCGWTNGCGRRASSNLAALPPLLIEAGAVRVNGTRITRPGRDVTPGDTLTFPQGPRIRVIRILALGLRRGPAPEAQALYLDLEPVHASAPDPLE